VRRPKRERRAAEAPRADGLGAQTSAVTDAAFHELRALIEQAAAHRRGSSLTEGLPLPLSEDELAILDDEALEAPPTDGEASAFRERDLRRLTVCVLREVRERERRQREVLAEMANLLECLHGERTKRFAQQLVAAGGIAGAAGTPRDARRKGRRRRRDAGR
jgi:hypothetical protein